MKGIADRFAEDAEIQLELAKGAVNAINGYGAAQKWEKFITLLNDNPTFTRNQNLRALWGAQKKLVELLRVKFSDTPEKEENGAVYQVAHYISVEDLERMIQLKEEKKKDQNGEDIAKPEKLQLKSVSSTNDPTEGKIFQQFLNTETAVREKQNEKNLFF